MNCPPSAQAVFRWYLVNGTEEAPVVVGARTPVASDGSFSLTLTDLPPQGARFAVRHNGLPQGGQLGLGLLDIEAPGDSVASVRVPLEGMSLYALMLQEAENDLDLPPGWSLVAANGAFTPLPMGTVQTGILAPGPADISPLLSCTATPEVFLIQTIDAAEAEAVVANEESLFCWNEEDNAAARSDCSGFADLLCQIGCPIEIYTLPQNEAHPSGWPCPVDNRPCEGNQPLCQDGEQYRCVGGRWASQDPC